MGTADRWSHSLAWEALGAGQCGERIDESAGRLNTRARPSIPVWFRVLAMFASGFWPSIPVRVLGCEGVGPASLFGLGCWCRVLLDSTPALAPASLFGFGLGVV